MDVICEPRIRFLRFRQSEARKKVPRLRGWATMVRDARHGVVTVEHVPHMHFV